MTAPDETAARMGMPGAPDCDQFGYPTALGVAAPELCAAVPPPPEALTPEWLRDLSAEVLRLRADLEHERHEKETVAEAGQAMVNYLRAENAKLRATMQSAPEALTPEEWSLIERSLERTTSCDRKFPMGTRQLGPFIDLLAKLRRLRPVVEGK